MPNMSSKRNVHCLLTEPEELLRVLVDVADPRSMLFLSSHLQMRRVGFIMLLARQIQQLNIF